MNIQCNYSYDPQCWVSVAPWEQVSLAFEAPAWAFVSFPKLSDTGGICLLYCWLFFSFSALFAMFNLPKSIYL